MPHFTQILTLNDVKKIQKLLSTLTLLIKVTRQNEEVFRRFYNLTLDHQI